MDTTRDINTVDNLTTIDNLTTDRILISDNSLSLKKISLSDLAKAIIEQYTMTFDGGQERSIQNSLSFIADNDGAHNAIYRGKYLGAVVTAQQWQAISSGTFKDLFIGDYWTINGINWRIAAFNYWYNTGYDTNICKTNHVVIVPDTCLVTPNGSTGLIENGSSSLEHGYLGTGYYSGTNNDSSVNTSKATCINLVNAAFGSSHLLHHTEIFTSTVNNSITTGYSRTDSTVELMEEPMVYGSYIFGLGEYRVDKRDVGTASEWQSATSGFMQTIGCIQLPLFSFNRKFLCSDYSWWLRTIDSTYTLCFVSKYGSCGNGLSNKTDYGIRPVFGIK